VDFVVVGFGVGALGLLLGVVCLAWGARQYGQAQRTAPHSGPNRALGGAMALRDAGQVFLSAGGAILLATVGALVTSLDDATGALVVTTTITVAALGILLWVFLHRARIPYLMPRPRPRPAVARAERQPARGAPAMPMAMVAAMAKPLTFNADGAEAEGADAEPAAAPASETADDATAGGIAGHEAPAADAAIPEDAVSAEELPDRADAVAVAPNGKEPVVDGALHDSEAVAVPAAAPDERGAHLQPTPDDDEDTI
jgi:hypothetical protein